MNWQTVYDSSQIPLWQDWVLPPIAVLLLTSFVFFLSSPQFFIMCQEMKGRSTTPQAATSLGRAMRFLSCLLFVLFTSVYGFGFWKHSEALQYLQTSCTGPGALVVQGQVEHFDPMPVRGHKNESFDVAGKHFEYSDYDLTNPGFKNAASHGGPIHDGLLVRIHYAHAPSKASFAENWIGKLETAQSE
jgi:hypothetical protein